MMKAKIVILMFVSVFLLATKGCPLSPAPVARTGQTESYVTGDDGDLQKGVAWPKPRFTDNGNGTVTDNLTGLIWLKDANCFEAINWSDAVLDCNGLASGSCGLTDSSNIGDWRLPNLFELESLRDMEYYLPALSNTAGTGQWSEGAPFTKVQSSSYWSSTSIPDTHGAWIVDMSYGTVDGSFKDDFYYVWPVREGQ